MSRIGPVLVALDDRLVMPLPTMEGFVVLPLKRLPADCGPGWSCCGQSEPWHHFSNLGLRQLRVAKDLQKENQRVDLRRAPMKNAEPKARAKAALRCLRCGQPGHFASNCPVPSKVAGTKRPAPATESVAMLENAHVTFQDGGGHERHDVTMLDPGASAFLSGYGPARRYLHYLSSAGYPIDQIQFYSCRHKFHSNGDGESCCHWIMEMPMCVAGSYGRAQVFLLKGETPMLCGRPIIEALGLVMDFQRRQVKFKDTPWREATIGLHGEYLLPLWEPDQPMEFVRSMDLDFDLRLAPEGGVDPMGISLEQFETEETAFAMADEPLPPSTSTSNDGWNAPGWVQSVPCLHHWRAAQASTTTSGVGGLHRPWQSFCQELRSKSSLWRLDGTLMNHHTAGNFWPDWMLKFLMNSGLPRCVSIGAQCNLLQHARPSSRKTFKDFENGIIPRIWCSPRKPSRLRWRMVLMLTLSSLLAQYPGALRPCPNCLASRHVLISAVMVLNAVTLMMYGSQPRSQPACWPRREPCSINFNYNAKETMNTVP